MLLALAGASTSGLLVTVVALYFWHNKPEVLGLPPRPLPGADTIKVVSEAEILKVKSDSLEQALRTVSDSLHRVSSSLTNLQSEHKQMSEKIEIDTKEREKKETALRDSTRLKNLIITAEMYEKAQASEVAKILSESEPEYSASILKLMKRKNAAKVLELMPTKKAVKVTKLMAAA